MMSPAYVRARVSVRLLALLLALSAGWPAIPSARAAALLIPTGLTVEQDDRNAILQWDFDIKNPMTPLPTGVAGYKITWGPAATPNAFSKLTEERIIQLQPLTNGQPYVARVQSVDSAGHVSAASPTVSFTGISARVDALRTRMNGFFDDFNLPAGAPDERKWNSAYSRCNADSSNGFFINDQFHAHNTVFSGNCDRGQSISRPRAALDFSDNGTRTIVFDWDGEFRRSQWYLDLVPRLMDISGQVNLEGISMPADPANGLRIHQNEQVVSIDAFGLNGALTTPAHTDSKPYLPLDWAGLKQVSNVRRHWEIHIRRDYAEILINGVKVLATAPGAFQLTEDRYYLLWNVFSYNTAKANVPFVLGHWDNFGFDAPAGTTHDTVTHNYRLVNTGTDFMKAFGKQSPAQATIKIPDAVDGAVMRRLMFTIQMEANGSYT
ncbi:MAG: fibronectin type III domain-containing protein, partial [Roseiflexaceae bacterium]